jgi:hypothetical protein
MPQAFPVVWGEDHQPALIAAGTRKRPTVSRDRSIIVGGNRDGEPARGRQPDIRAPVLNAPNGATVRGFTAADTVKLASLSERRVSTHPPQPDRRLNTRPQVTGRAADGAGHMIGPVTPGRTRPRR